MFSYLKLKELDMGHACCCIQVMQRTKRRWVGWNPEAPHSLEAESHRRQETDQEHPECQRMSEERGVKKPRKGSKSRE